MRYFFAGIIGTLGLIGTANALFAETILTKVNVAETRREAEVGKIVSVRKYILKNKRWDKDAVMHVRITSQPNSKKQFDIVSMENAEGLQKKVFLKLLEAEAESSHEAESALTSDNYDFEIIGNEVWNGRECLVLDLKPKRNSKYLIVGKAWVDTTERAIVRIDGKTARNVSFWIGKPHVTQEFRKVDDIWVSSANRSVSDVKLMGRTELVIDFVDYEISRRRAVASAKLGAGF
ncbi:MAG TPA: outer membrane lipoprotein-sorting protein [Bryobacteraceae bacterium]|nr:outer membrane lipoprotein-sorting protein [Bryobacteraceae bacterium]